jgi:serine/threonine-protein kinase 24/25/MST4
VRRSEEDISEIQREIAMLKQCQSPHITSYFGSAVVPGTSQLMIVMELMSASAADLVRPPAAAAPWGRQAAGSCEHAARPCSVAPPLTAPHLLRPLAPPPPPPPPSRQVSEETGGEPLPEPCIAYVLRRVLLALAYLHGEQRMHRDVKAANILLAEGGDVKVSDFGVSAQLG